MTIEIKAPTFPESIADGTVAAWHRRAGDQVQRDELLVEIETDKVVLEVVAPAAGRLTSILKAEGETVLSEELIAELDETAALGPTQPEAPSEGPDQAERPEVGDDEVSASPAARKLAMESGLDIQQIEGTGKAGRITREDVAQAASARQEPAALVPEPAPLEPGVAEGERVVRRVPMTRLRASIARRLVEAQHNAAMLTTFNEVDMGPIMTMRRRYQEEFQARHNGTRLGFMSFFVRASVEALKRFPSVNASIDENDILYHGYYDIGVAVSTERGLVVPVIRDADALSLAQIEDQVNDFAARAQDGKLSIEDMSGGTFTISNGGVFGSLLSTPILNPPQTAILGMHKIQDRPVAVDGEVVVRPMMYLALSYDHRLIDGQEAVRFLVTIKGLIEDPARILLEL
ncbi:MAG: 2-oxoglutarate dehydrogenase complex dihydrolipoyllysine-residue succinyltransferase [Pseudomonadales bacterium]|nr:2-oxoglutarate dehydrogenase complex dihydrolipoyllysine-residue succinyltransferase [Pseudomonadales bacterium]NIX07667.1 2-oxoglutarate dehydrogenase complex dihydrolipoyllysine-residue succinyltransferase [Pseudomonadales bacterium]